MKTRHLVLSLLVTLALIAGSVPAAAIDQPTPAAVTLENLLPEENNAPATTETDPAAALTPAEAEFIESLNWDQKICTLSCKPCWSNYDCGAWEGTCRAIICP